MQKQPLPCRLISAFSVLGILLLVGSPDAHAQSSGYKFVYLDSTNINGAASVYGVGDGYIVAQGVTVGDYSHASCAWDLHSGTRFLLDQGANGAQVRGASGNQAVGVYIDSNSNSLGVAWDLPTNTMRFLDNSGISGVSAQGATGSNAVGYGFTPGASYSAYSWNLQTGVRTQLDSTGLIYSGAFGAGEGYALGEGQGVATGGTTKPIVWDLATNTRTILNATGLQYSGISSLTNGYAIGYGNGAATNYQTKFLRWNLATGDYTTFDQTGLSSESYGVTINGAGAGIVVGNGVVNGGTGLNRALAWNPTTGTYSDLQAFMPSTVTDSEAYRVGDDGTIGVYWGITNLISYTGIGGHAALIPFASNGFSDFAVASGETATSAASVTQNGGVTTINGNYQVKDASGTPTYTLTGGTLKGTGTITAGLFNMTGGTLAPGNSPGTLTINGDFSQSGGTYAIEIASLSMFDILNVTGTATFTGGVFSVTTWDGFTPTIGDFFDVITTGTGIVGASTVTTPSGWTFTQNGNNGRLSFSGVAVIPEAGTFALLLSALGSVGMTLIVRNRRR